MLEGTKATDRGRKELELSEKKQVSDKKYDYLLRKLTKANDVSAAFA